MRYASSYICSITIEELIAAMTFLSDNWMKIAVALGIGLVDLEGVIDAGEGFRYWQW